MARYRGNLAIGDSGRAAGDQYDGTRRLTYFVGHCWVTKFDVTRTRDFRTLRLREVPRSALASGALKGGSVIRMPPPAARSYPPAKHHPLLTLFLEDCLMNGRLTPKNSSGLLLAALAACGSQPGVNRVIVGDSAGVVLVQHGPEQPRGVEHWFLEPRPMVEIGSVEGDEAYLFTRIVEASGLPGGDLLVADRATSDFRIFDSTGRFVRRFGRKGSGPGEFQELTWVGVDPAGYITAYDGILRRLSRFLSDGTLKQVTPVPSSPDASFGTVIGQFSDGSILMRSLVALPDADRPSQLSTGLVRDSVGLFRISPDGSSRIPVGRFAGNQYVRAVGKVIAQDPAPFGLRTVIAAASNVYYLSTQEAYEIRSYRKEGGLDRIIRRQVPPQPVSASASAEWQRQRDGLLKRIGSGAPLPPQVTELANYRTLPDVFPSHGELMVDRAGNLWVGDYRPFPSQDTLTTWMVFNPEGEILATAELPNARLTEIRGDHVVGVWRDDNDVERVRVYRIGKRGRRGETRD